MAAMSVGQMVELFVKPGAPIYVKAFDGSTYGSEDAPVTLVIRNSRAIYYLVNAPGELGLTRAYLQGDIDSPQLDPGNPYALFGKLVDVKPYLRTPNPAQLAKALASVASHGIRRPEPPAIEGPGRMRRMSEGLLPHTRKGDAATVSYYYDQSNDFYVLFLGPSMTYTCAPCSIRPTHRSKRRRRRSSTWCWTSLRSNRATGCSTSGAVGDRW